MDQEILDNVVENTQRASGAESSDGASSTGQRVEGELKAQELNEVKEMNDKEVVNMDYLEEISFDDSAMDTEDVVPVKTDDEEEILGLDKEKVTEESAGGPAGPKEKEGRSPDDTKVSHDLVAKKDGVPRSSRPGSTAKVVVERRRAKPCGENDGKRKKPTSARSSLHPLHPGYRCFGDSVRMGTAKMDTRCCWDKLKVQNVSCVRWRSASEEGDAGRIASSLVGFGREVMVRLSGDYLWKEQEEMLGAQESSRLELWAAAAALKTAASSCAHIAVALSLAGMGSVPEEVVEGWKEVGIDWSELEGEIRKETVVPWTTKKDVIIVPLPLMTESMGLSFPGAPASPKGQVIGFGDFVALEELLVKQEIRRVFMTVDTTLQKGAFIDALDRLNRSIYTTNDKLHKERSAILLSPPVTEVDAYKKFHRMAKGAFDEWKAVRRLKNRPVCLVSMLYDGESAVEMDDYVFRCGVIGNRCLGRSDVFNYVSGVRKCFKSQGFASMFDAAHPADSSRKRRVEEVSGSLPLSSRSGGGLLDRQREVAVQEGGRVRVCAGVDDRRAGEDRRRGGPGEWDSSGRGRGCGGFRPSFNRRH